MTVLSLHSTKQITESIAKSPIWNDIKWQNTYQIYLIHCATIISNPVERWSNRHTKSRAPNQQNIGKQVRNGLEINGKFIFIQAWLKKMSGRCDKLIKKIVKNAFRTSFFFKTGHILYNGARESCSHKCSITLRTDIFSEPGQMRSIGFCFWYSWAWVNSAVPTMFSTKTH